MRKKGLWLLLSVAALFSGILSSCGEKTITAPPTGLTENSKAFASDTSLIGAWYSYQNSLYFIMNSDNSLDISGAGNTSIGPIPDGDYVSGGSWSATTGTGRLRLIVTNGEFYFLSQRWAARDTIPAFYSTSGKTLTVWVVKGGKVRVSDATVLTKY